MLAQEAFNKVMVKKKSGERNSIEAMMEYLKEINVKSQAEALQAALGVVKLQEEPFEQDCLFLGWILYRELTDQVRFNNLKQCCLQTMQPKVPDNYSNYQEKDITVEKLVEKVKAQFDLTHSMLDNITTTFIGGLLIGANLVQEQHFAVLVQKKNNRTYSYLDPSLLTRPIVEEFGKAVKKSDKHILAIEKPMVVIMTPDADKLCSLQRTAYEEEMKKAIIARFKTKKLYIGATEYDFNVTCPTHSDDEMQNKLNYIFINKQKL